MSTTINPVNWFEIPVLDLERATAFYEAVFGYQLTKSEMGPVQMAMFPINGPTIPGACGALVKGECFVPSKTGTLVYFSVPDIDVALELITTSGGKVLRPRTAIGQYGFIGHFEDCEGNGVALHSFV